MEKEKGAAKGEEAGCGLVKGGLWAIPLTQHGYFAFAHDTRDCH